MTAPDTHPALYDEARALYGRYRQLADSYLNTYFTNPQQLLESERAITSELRREWRRLRWLRLFPTDIEKETFRLIRFFFLRERREEVRYRNYSSYLRDFMKRNRKRMITPWNPPAGFTLDDVISELVSRISPPFDGPFPVLTEWLPMKMREAADVIPEDILAGGGLGKVFRVVCGVYLYALTDLKSDMPVEEAKSRLEMALKGGYYFGLLHPMADDVLDSASHLSPAGKLELMRLMDHWIGGDFTVSPGVPAEAPVLALKECIRELYSLFPPEQRKELILLSYCLHFAQMEDLLKDPSAPCTMSAVYVPVFLKASLTRLMSCWLSGTRLNEGLTNEMIETGLVFQLMDDFRDICTDLEERCFTPFTHYLLSEPVKPVNPWLIYVRALHLFIANSPNRQVSARSLLRRVAIAVQNFGADGDPVGGTLDVLFAGLPNSYLYVNKIIKYPERIVDPDKALFDPVDRYYQQKGKT